MIRKPEEPPDWSSTFEGPNLENKWTTMGVIHHWDSGVLTITLDGEESKSCCLDSSEWLRLLNVLLAFRQMRNWIDSQKDDADSNEINDKLKLFQEMGLKDKTLLRAVFNTFDSRLPKNFIRPDDDPD
jgi:hypothetical protein